MGVSVLSGPTHKAQMLRIVVQTVELDLTESQSDMRKWFSDPLTESHFDMCKSFLTCAAASLM